MAKQIYLSNLTKRFRVLLEESFAHERPEVRNPDRRWYEIIPCKGFKPGPGQEGPFISLFSEDPPTFHLHTDRVKHAKIIWRQIRKEPGTRADFMDGEAILYFPPTLLEQVAELADGRKKRPPMSEDQKMKLAEARQKAGLTRDEKGRLVHAQGEITSQKRGDLTEARA